MIDDRTLFEEASDLLDLLRAHELHLATAESCTGGLISAYLTEAPGSSNAIEVGFVTYSNVAKQTVLGVREESLRAHGAVSEVVAREMAEGALGRLGDVCQVAVSVTGIAGPSGGSEEKPVGTVHLAAAGRGWATLHRAMAYGDIGRRGVRMESVRTAFELVRELVEANLGPAKTR